MARTLNRKDNLEQKLVDKRFDERSTYWKDIYRKKDIHGFIYQQRMAVALSYIEQLSLPQNSRVLEIGCGAGFMSIALARNGFSVESVDHAPMMIASTQRHASEAGVDNRVHTAIEDVHNLSFKDQSFELVVALGVVPWLYDLRTALLEITRVLVPNGYAVLNMDNRCRVNAWVDFPILLQGKVADTFEAAGVHNPHPPRAHARSYSVKEFNHYLDGVDLTNVKDTSIGFGPFRLFSHSIFSDPVGIKIHQKLQKYADIGYPILRMSGSQYVIVARKKK